MWRPAAACVFVWNMPNFARMMYTGIIGRRRVSLVEAPICERCGSVLHLQAKQCGPRARGAAGAG